MELTQQLHQINTLLAEIDAAYHQAAVRLHIADSALAVLYILRDAGDGCPLRTVYRQYGMSKQTVNSALRKLEEDGCLFLEPGPGRSKTLHLTATGKQRVEGTAERLQAAERRVFERWTPEDRAAYVRADFHRRLGQVRHVPDAYLAPERDGRSDPCQFHHSQRHDGGRGRLPGRKTLPVLRRLWQFAVPSIAMMIIESIYSIVDGFFVSNYAGKAAFAAVNLMIPLLLIPATTGLIFGTGGAALVGQCLGEGQRDKANRLFSLFTVVTLSTGTVLTLAGAFWLEDVLRFLGANGDLLRDCRQYARIILFSLPCYTLQIFFHSFFATSGKPSVGGLYPLYYFLRRNDSLLRLSRPAWSGRAVVQAMANGSSEFMGSIAMSLVGLLYNFQLLRYAGTEGIAAYGVMMYISMIFASVFTGYSVGTAPVISFQYGAENYRELRSVLRKSLLLLLGSGLAMTLGAELFAAPLCSLFVGYDAALLEKTVSGFHKFALSFFLMGFGIYGSAFFTALNEGLISALIAFLRTFVFETAAVLLLPLFLGISGIWYSVVVAEAMALVLTAWFLVRGLSRMPS